jgi:hypothetical protein
MSTRADIEDGVIRLLAPLLQVHLTTEPPTSVTGGPGGYLNFLGYYKGELEGLSGEDAQEQARRRLSGRVPGILLATGRGNHIASNVQRRLVRKSLDVHVIIFSASMRTYEARARGTGADPGLYAIADDVFDRLMGTKPPDVDGAGKLIAGQEVLELIHESLSAIRVVYQVEAFIEAVKVPSPGTPLDGVNTHAQTTEDDPDDRAEYGEVDSDAS